MYSTLLAGKAVGIVTILYYVYCIVGGCCTFIVGYGCIRRHFNDWEYIRRLQNKFMANDAARSCFSSKLCNFIYGIFSVYYAYFRCSCRSISIQNAERIEHWRELFGRSVSITTANLSDMKTSYINNNFVTRTTVTKTMVAWAWYVNMDHLSSWEGYCNILYYIW